MLPTFFRALALAALLIVAPGAGGVARAQLQSAGFPLPITDDAGVSPTFSAPPQRVVSLNPGLTEITFALGHGDQLVAVDTFSDFPVEAKAIQPRLNTYPGPSIETIVALQPDVVLSLADRDEDVALIRQQGVP